MSGTRSSSVDVLNNGHQGRSSSGQELGQLREDSLRRYQSDSGDGLIGRFLNGGPSARSYSPSTLGQQNRDGRYPDDYSKAARAA